MYRYTGWKWLCIDTPSGMYRLNWVWIRPVNFVEGCIDTGKSMYRYIKEKGLGIDTWKVMYRYIVARYRLKWGENLPASFYWRVYRYTRVMYRYMGLKGLCIDTWRVMYRYMVSEYRLKVGAKHPVDFGFLMYRYIGCHVSIHGSFLRNFLKGVSIHRECVSIHRPVFSCFRVLIKGKSVFCPPGLYKLTLKRQNLIILQINLS